MSRITVEEIARACHEQNKAYCESIGDNSQVSWADAPQWQRDSCINGVRAKLKDPHAPFSQSHNNWYQHKLEQGWTYGPVKDEAKKEHPCMVPFEELPIEQSYKDELFCNKVNMFRDNYEIVDV